MKKLELKAWDTINNCWIDIFKICLAVDGQVIAVESIDGESYGLHQIELIRFTSLKDRSSKKIFEGDFLEGNHKLMTFKVYFGENKDYDRTGWCIDSLQSKGTYFLDKIEATYMKIIGNIYENKELLSAL